MRCLPAILVSCALAPMSAAEDGPGSITKHVATLTAQLKHGKTDARTDAAARLGELGPFAAPAIPALLAATRGDDLALRHEAIIALGAIGPPAKSAMPALSGLLADKSALVRHASATALRRVGIRDASATRRLRGMLKETDPLLRVTAARTLLALESANPAVVDAVVPVLLEALKDKSPQVRNTAAIALPAAGQRGVAALVRVVQQGAPQCTHAADALAVIGPDAAAAVPALLKHLKDRDVVCWHSARALGAIGAQPDQVVPPLSSLLTHKSASVRASAATALGAFGSKSQSAVGALVKRLGDTDVNVRLSAAGALGRIGPGAKAAVPALDRALDDAVGAVTLNAAEALGRIGAPALGVLRKRLKDPVLNSLAATVLADLGPAAKPAIPELLELIRHKNRETRSEAVIALASIGESAKAAIPELIRLVQTPKAVGRAGAVYALVKIGASEKAVTPLLKVGVADKSDEMLRLASAWALVTYDPENSDYVKLALPGLIAALTHEHPVVRREMATALGNIGPPAAEAISALTKSLQNADPELRAESLHALGQIGAKARTAIPLAAKLLDDPDPGVRVSAAYYFARLGSDSKPTIPRLQALLKSKIPFERTVAAWALVQIDPRPEFVRIAIPLLIKSLEHESPSVRRESAETLGRIGKGNARVIAALKKRSSDQDDSVKKAVRQALERLQQ